jgi:hypothetical protein
MYNLTVDQDHTYAVGDGGTAVIRWRDTHEAMQAADE